MSSEAVRPTKRMKTDHERRDDRRDDRRDKHQHMGRWKAQQAQSKHRPNVSASGIHGDDVGIFVTCDKGQERKCLSEIHDLLSQYLEAEGPDQKSNTAVADDDDDIEAEIQAELDGLKAHRGNEDGLKLITLDIPCVSFVRTGPGIDPVATVHQICTDALSQPDLKRSRYIKRMTPMTLMKKTLGGGLDQLCETVLKPHFHSGGPSKKFAIRPTIRNNNQLDRDTVIKTVAAAVGNEHRVDLKNYDLLILVDVYRNVCGMSVVGNDYERLKRFNLAEIYQPAPKPEVQVPVDAN